MTKRVEDTRLAGISAVGGEECPRASVALCDQHVRSRIQKPFVVIESPTKSQRSPGLVGEFAVVKAPKLKRESFSRKLKIHSILNVITGCEDHRVSADNHPNGGA